MFKRFFITLLLYIPVAISAQTEADTLTGKVSYLSSVNVYVNFANTDIIQPGDTLFILSGTHKLEPALIVRQKSSISCVCDPVEGISVSREQILYFPVQKSMLEKAEPLQEELITEKKEGGNEIKDKVDAADPIEPAVTRTSLNGRISASSYHSFSDGEFLADPTLRYTFSLKGNDVMTKGLGFDSYVSFRHTVNEWADVQENLQSALKIYNLAVNYEIGNLSLSFGRKINPMVSNIGAIDGAQINYRMGNWTLGTLLGTRPDHFDYGLNLSLPEAGLFTQHQYQRNSLSLKNTLGVFEQRSGNLTDRRYLYFQHSGSYFKKLFLFGSFELDLYKKLEEQASGDLRLTSMYLSARYRFSRKFDVFASYDNRKNIIYYETFKNSLDQLIEDETRQGLRLRFTLRPLKFTSIGLSGTIRMQANGLQPTRNVNAYVSYSRIPWIRSSVSLNYTYLDTYYMQSQIYGIRLNKDFLKGRLGSTFQYRFVNYNYYLSGKLSQQHLAGINLNYRIFPELSLSLNHEITLNGDLLQQRSYIKLIKRIKN